MSFEKYYDELGISCKIENGHLSVTGADGRYHILQDLFSLNLKNCYFSEKSDALEYDILEISNSLRKVIDQAEDVKRVYHYTAGWEICSFTFGRKSKYVDYTVKYPLNTHIRFAEQRTGQIPIEIFYELLQHL